MIQSRVDLKRFRPRLTAEDLAFLCHVLQVFRAWLEKKSDEAWRADYELKRVARQAWNRGTLESVRKFKETKKQVALLKALSSPITTDILICRDLERRFRDLARGKRPRAHADYWLQDRELTLEHVQLLGSNRTKNLDFPV